jgi:hypothetical protein
MEEGVRRLNDNASVPPNLTAVASVKSVPVMLTIVFPSVGPELGITPVTVGAAKAAWAGLVHWIAVSESTWTLFAALLPKCTAAFGVKPASVMVTKVAPASGPELGYTLVTAGPSV